VKNNFVITCGTYELSEEDEKKNGIVGAHEYSFVSVKELVKYKKNFRTKYDVL